MSSTSLSSSFNATSTVATTESPNPYDYQGAALYIAVILIWYSSGLALMLFLQIRPRTLQSQFLFDSSTINKLVSSTTNPFANYHNIQADNTTKQILNELKDPERRQRLWKIYYASEEEHNEPHPQYYQTITADSATVGRINRKLADIHRMVARDDDHLVSTRLDVPSNNDNCLTSGSESTKSFIKRFSSIRRPIGGGSTTTRPRLIRVRSQPDTASATTIGEMAPFKSEPKPATNDSRKRNNKFSTRFTVENVSEK